MLKFSYADPNTSSEIFLTRDPVWKKFGSGINIQDPQHWVEGAIYVFQFIYILFYFSVVFLYRMSYLFQAFVSVIPRRKGAEEKEDSDT